MSFGRDIQTLTNVIKILRREVDEHFPVQMVHVILAVAQRPGITTAELVKETDLSQPAVSRLLTSLGKEHYTRKKAGYNIVDTVDDPEDSRRKISFLTKKGRDLMGQLIGVLHGTTQVDFESPVARAHVASIVKARSGV
ncbi:MarR family winged helix-turn-helix transcriptional regulator [Bosea minatitlanensis]|uniref:MarR family winged helix-turn-helix transcriptional regulator n=1 Tax=Bosea minatitlanensis TaxID=128782 RepID=A0ABW0EYB9_9HYPH|nr:MarR family winged helix-turn-helix transcriptional regulator [Bosea minatitlanensis]MCT4492406.1 MarR family winged helix-turn-helix transcriptional regulator [Bosea minatitlanensis]